MPGGIAAGNADLTDPTPVTGRQTKLYRGRAVAVVRSAVALDDAQVQKLAVALGRATKKNIEVRVVVDPTLMGGLVATIGDTVIDGTVRHRLDQLKETL